MAMRPKLWSLNGLSVELGIGARALAKKLKHTPPDGKVGGREGWYMSSAVSAIENDRGGNGGGYGGSDRDAVLDEIAADNRQARCRFQSNGRRARRGTSSQNGH